MWQKLKKRYQDKVEYLNIKQKLNLGFGTLIGFMGIIILVTLISLLVIRSNINEIIEEHEPTMFASITLGLHIKAATSSLGFYLLSKEDEHKKAYLNTLVSIDTELSHLKQFDSIQKDLAAQKLVDDLENDIKKFKQYQKNIFELATNNSKNIPGIVFAAENLNPISQQILQNLSQMLQSEADQTASNKRKQLLIDIEALRYNWVNVMSGIRAYLAYRTVRTQDEIKLYKEQVDTLIKKVQKQSQHLTFDQADSLEQILQFKKDFYVNLEQLYKIHSSEQWRQDAHLIRTEISPLLSQANEKIKSLTTLQRNKIDNANSGLVGLLATIIILSLIILAVAIIFSSRIAVKLIKDIVDPLNNAVDITGRIASGDLTVNVEESSENEIGQLMSALNMMTANLGSLIAKVQTSGIQVTSSSTEIAATAKQQEATVTQQAATANQISTTATEISATVNELVSTMDEVTDVAETTANEAVNSQAALADMEQTMHQMMNATNSIGSKLSVLSEKAENINSVVTTITKVADQTNLLSLNAAIEAEKAGEYGVGFAVVATEIRRLADQTAVATWDIEQMVKEMQSAVSAGVMGMDKFSEEVRSGVDDVREVSVQIAAIIEQVQALLPRFEVVHSGMQNQAQGAQQITESITQLSDGTQQTADSLRQSSASITQLHVAAKSLQESVSKFKVKNN